MQGLILKQVKSIWSKAIVAALVAGVGWGMAGCSGSPPDDASLPADDVSLAVTPTRLPNPAGLNFDGERALAHVAAQMAIGPRPTGSAAHARTGDYILEQLQAAGWQAEVQSFIYQGVEARNIIGKAPQGRSDGPVYLIGAHYDTRMRADEDAFDRVAGVPGANDGASGVAVLLELAVALDLDTIDGQVWLVFFDAEDNGRLDGWDWIAGSRYFADTMTLVPQFAIIVDMVGDADQQVYYERNSDVALMERIWATAGELGYQDWIIPEYRFTMLDDHTPFLEKGVPAVDIIDFDYPYWHTTDDTLDKVSGESLARIGRTLEYFLEDMRWLEENEV